VVTLTSFRTIGLNWRRLSSCIVSWVWSNVCLNIGSIGYIVDDVTSGIDRIVCWSISHRVGWRVGWRVGYNIGSGVDRLRYFVSASTFFSQLVEGTLATTSLARMLRSTSGVGICCVSRTSFFNLSSCDVDISLEASDHWGIFEVVQSGKSGSQVGLRRVVNFESIVLEVPEEVSRAVCWHEVDHLLWGSTRLLLWSSWRCRRLLPDVGVDLTDIGRLLACT
jgi:hypothetical protein